MQDKYGSEIDSNQTLRFLQSFYSYYPMCDVDLCTEPALNFFALKNGKALALCPDCEYLFSSIDWNNPPRKNGEWPEIYERKTGIGPLQRKFAKVLSRLDKGTTR